jgi:hypothetical protein
MELVKLGDDRLITASRGWDKVIGDMTTKNNYGPYFLLNPGRGKKANAGT